MKRLAMVVLVAAPLLGAGAVTAQQYPPGAATLTLGPSTVAPGGTFTATLDGCELGESVSVSVEGGASASGTCSGTGGGAARGIMQPAGGSASVTLAAPTAPGTYTVTATSPTVTATATLTVTGGAAPAAPGAGELPTTGSDSTPLVQIALGALLAGIALVGVAMYRRRTAVSA